MKTQTVHSLITARTLFDEARRLIEFGDRHSCSAALLLLQDSLEIVMLALLIELGVDESVTLESKGFNELIGELKKAEIKVPKSGTLKALNQTRVVVKHYGQLAEPLTVQNYAEAAEAAIDSIVRQVLKRSLREIFLSDRLDPGEAKTFLNEALRLLEVGELLGALVEVRKAIFVTIEHEYSIEQFAGYNPDQDRFGLNAWSLGGMKAPVHAKNAEWIRRNVNHPVDYVQVDHERLRLDCMEWGGNTIELENLRRLTPDVFRGKDGLWCHRLGVAYWGAESHLNANYCIDRAIAMVLKIQLHNKSQKHLTHKQVSLHPGYQGGSVFEKASVRSMVCGMIDLNQPYVVFSVVSGFEANQRFYHLAGLDPTGKRIFGFLKEVAQQSLTITQN